MLIRSQDISTHSLTKRLTITRCGRQLFLYISTHSLTKRLTFNKTKELEKENHFNSQPHEEADAG